MLIGRQSADTPKKKPPKNPTPWPEEAGMEVQRDDEVLLIETATCFLTGGLGPEIPGSLVTAG